MTEAEGESRTEAASDGGIEGVLEQMRLGVSEEDSLRAAVYVATVRPAQASQRYNYKRRSSEAAADSEAVIREEERFLSEDLQTGEGGMTMMPAQRGEGDTISDVDIDALRAGKGQFAMQSEVTRVSQVRAARRALKKELKQRRVQRAIERQHAKKQRASAVAVDDDMRMNKPENETEILLPELQQQQTEKGEGLNPDRSIARVSLVQRHEVPVSTTAHTGPKDTVSGVAAEDGLPTAIMTVKGVQKSIKLDSCARYTIAGTSWMKYGYQLENRAPVDHVEGIGGFLLDVVGVWRFKLRSVLNEEVVIDACIVEGCDEEFLLGVDFMMMHNAVMDFERSELRYRGQIRAIVIPFQTYDLEGVARPASVRMARKMYIEDNVVRPVAIAVSAKDGEQGIFLPTQHIGAVMLAATVTTVREGRAWIPAINANTKTMRLPHRRDLGTWIPLSSDIEALEVSGEMNNDRIKSWLDEMGDTKEPLDNESEINIGTEEPKARELILKLLRTYRKLTNSTGDCPPATALDVHHHIDTGDSAPIMQKRRRQAQVEDQIINDNVTKMLQAGVIEEGNGAWGFPVVLVRKKDGEVRFCVDYRALNRVTKKDVYPLPRIDETLEALGGALLFSTLDLKAGYWQILVADEDKDKTAFTTKRGLFRFLRMPFGLTNAPSTFQRMMNQVLRGLTWQTCLVYLDDIVVFTKGGIEQHVLELACVFERLAAAGLTLKLKKCTFATKKMEYLGHELSCDGVRPLQRLITAVQEFPRPNNAVEAKRFVHLAGYYRRFVEGFGSLMAPVTKLLRKTAEWEWGDQQEAAFQRVKTILTTKPLLLYPDFRLPFRVVTDASATGLGACLMQDQGKGWQPIAYASKVNSETEAKYGITELECLAVVWAVKLFRPYLYGRRFEILTDHAALKWLMTSPNLTGKLHRWALTLQEFDLDVQYRPGKNNVVADALSRAPVASKVLAARGRRRRAGKQSKVVTNLQNEGSSGVVTVDVQLPRVGSSVPGSGEGATVEKNAASTEQFPEVTVEASFGDRDCEALGKVKGGSKTLVGTGRRAGFEIGTKLSRREALQATPDESREVQSLYSAVGSAKERRKHTNEPKQTRPAGKRSPEVAKPKEGAGKSGLHVSGNPGNVTARRKQVTFAEPVVQVGPILGGDGEYTVPMQPRAVSKTNSRQEERDPTLQLTDAEIAEAQGKSKMVQRLVAAGEHRGRKVVVRHGLVLIETVSGRRVILPPELWAVVFKESHDSVWAGHLRAAHTYARIAQVYWWPDLMREVKKWVRGCQECGSRKARPREVIPPLRSLHGGDVCDRWALDVAGPLPVTEGGNRYVIAALEYVTRYAVAGVVKEHTAESVAKFLMQNVVLKFGTFREILTDGAPELTGKAMDQLVVLLQAYQRNPVPYRPQHIGLVERFNRTWKDCVATYMNTEEQHDWDVWVDFATYAYNSGQHSTVKLSPNELMMGRKLRSPNELLRSTSVREAGELTQYHQRLLAALESSRECAEKARKVEQERQARYYNRKTRKNREVKPGDKVWMFKPPRGPKASKFVHAWIGPLRVVEDAGYDNFLVEREDTEQVPERFIAHVSFLVQYHYPNDLLKKVASDLEVELSEENTSEKDVDEVAERRATDVTAAAKTVRAEVSSKPDAEVAAGAKRGRGAMENQARSDEPGEKLVELRRRRRRNKAGQYVLEFEVRPTSSRGGKPGAAGGHEERRWLSIQEYEELFHRDRVVEDSTGGEVV